MGGMVRGIRSLGSATIDLAYTAMGSFDIWWEEAVGNGTSPRGYAYWKRRAAADSTLRSGRQAMALRRRGDRARKESLERFGGGFESWTIRGLVSELHCHNGVITFGTGRVITRGSGLDRLELVNLF